jgi:oligopeptide/dipeptide ABC transporter ATP-binding protein
MYLGKIIETADSETIYRDARHPYTQSLIAAIPVPDPHCHVKRQLIQGDVPSAINPPAGCHFHPRCPVAVSQCQQEQPALRELSAAHLGACHLANSEDG